MDPEELKMRAAVCRDPADDTVRLAYADWLSENAPTQACWQCSGTGGAEWHDATHGAVDGPCNVCQGSGRLNTGADYAEFIRLSCELSKLPEPEYKTIGRMIVTDNGASIRTADDDPPFYVGGMCAKCYRLKDGEQCPYHALWSRGRALMHKGEQAQQWFVVPGLGVQLGFTPDRLNWWVQPGGPRIEAELERGFVRKVKCTAANWLAFADALVWHPAQTCRWCEGDGRVMSWPELPDDPPAQKLPCLTCDGSGFRPFPATAHPVEKVTLTTFPTAEVFGFNALRPWKKSLAWGGDTRDAFAAEWPWLTFEWPQQAPIATQTTGYAAGG